MDLSALTSALDRAGVERIADALAHLHTRDGGVSLEDGARLALDAIDRPERIYERAKQHFTANERTLRDQSSVAAQLVEHLRARDRGPLQHLLRLSSAAEGVAGGRFVLRNDMEHEATFRFRPTFVLPCAITPEEPRVAAGQSCAVDVRIQLDGSFGAGETATLLIDVLTGDSVRAKVWVDVVVEERA
jgi:hypothetical protein